MRKVGLICLAFIGICGVALPAAANVVDFNTLPGYNGAPLTSYTENGFTVTNAGNFDVGTQFGHGAPSIFALGAKNLNGGSGSGSLALTSANGGDFTLSSFDLFPDGSVNYGVVGTRNGATVFDVSGSFSDSAWQTVTFGADSARTVDRVTFSFLGSKFSYNVDNIVANVAAVPEPSTWAMIILGLGMIGFAARRRNAGVPSPA